MLLAHVAGAREQSEPRWRLPEDRHGLPSDPEWRRRPRRAVALPEWSAPSERQAEIQQNERDEQPDESRRPLGLKDEPDGLKINRQNIQFNINANSVFSVLMFLR